MPAPTRHEAQEQVLALAFEGRWSHAEMAERVHVSSRTIGRWLASPAFKVRIAEARANLAESLAAVVYADKLSRVVGLSQMAESARREYERRPLLVERRPTGRDEETGEQLFMEQEAFNRDAHEAFRKALDDIAKELGERSANVNVIAQSTNFGITVILEQMQHDPSIAASANDFLGLVAAVAETR